jgi:hypothetical protein
MKAPPPAASAAAVAAAASLLPAPLLAFLSWHRHQLLQRPYAANSATSAVLMCLGDRFAQHMEARGGGGGSGGGGGGGDGDAASEPALSPRASAVRTGVLTCWAALASTAWTRYYFYIFAKWPGRVLLWTALTAAVPAPIMNAAFFSFSTFGEHLLLRERPLAPEQLAACGAQLRRKLELQFAPTIVRSACVWVPTNLVNFYIVPLEYRMLAGSSVSFLWNIYLSLVQHTHAQPRSDEHGGNGGGSGGGSSSVGVAGPVEPASPTAVAAAIDARLGNGSGEAGDRALR